MMISHSYLRKRIGIVFICSLFPILLTILFRSQLYAVMNVSHYLIFHNIAEFFSVIVSFSIFGIGWYAYEQTNNRHILFLSTAFFVIGWLDFFHALSFFGMPAFFTQNSPNKAAQYWIAARLFMALFFLRSAFIYPNTQRFGLSKTVLMIECFVFPALVFMGITFFHEQMPVTIAEGVGLTPFKKNTEYLIIVLLCISLFMYWQRILKTGEKHLIYFLYAFVVCIFSEAVFTGFKSVFDTYNALGHIYKIVAFYLIYLGLFAVSVKNPYTELATTNKQLQEEIAERIKIELALKNYRDSLENLVTERTSELEKAKIVAEFANNSKSMFLSNMSHELRTPMNAILGLVFILKKSNLSDDNKLLLGKIHTAGQSLLGIINNVLDISKIESGKFELEMSVFNLHEILDNLATIMMFGASERNIDLIIHPPVSVNVHRLKGDSLRLQQVLVNLVGNAIKFTHQGHVDVNISVLECNENCVYLHFSVSDTGTGISKDAQKTIFTSFSQADNSITRRFGGTGLGLAISQQLVALMGGEISLTSELGKGSDFSFNLHFDYDDSENLLSEITTIDKKNGYINRLEGCRLLIVDDNEINLEVANRIFTTEGASVVTIDNGQQAVDWIRNNSNAVDLVLMDIQMPVMDGYDATRLIRQIPELLNLPVVALSAGVFTSQIELAKNVGINDFIAKPFDVEVAVNLIAKLTKPSITLKKQLFKMPLPISTAQFPVIDIKMALKIWKDVSIYKRYLLKFSTECELLLNAMTNENMGEFSRLIHKTKGAAKMLGLIEIGEITYEIDELINNSQDITQAIERLKEAITRTKNFIQEYTTTHQNLEPEIKLFDNVIVTNLLKLVWQNVEQDSPDGLTTTIDELSAYLTEKRIEPLKLALDSFDFPLTKSEIIKLATEFHLSLGV